MITLTVINNDGDCGANCPFLDTWHNYCLLFKEGLDTDNEWGTVIGRKACSSCNVVVDRAESYDYA
jgi:hypothetical protein